MDFRGLRERGLLDEGDVAIVGECKGMGPDPVLRLWDG